MNNCKRSMDLGSEVKVIRYEDFGAVGDGITDDSAAIRAAHNAANEAGLPVLARKDASYYIGSLESTIVVKTSTDWNGAQLIFDDSTIHWESNLRTTYVFTVNPDVEPTSIPVPEGLTLSKGQTNVGLSFDKPCMIKIESAGDKIYRRYGENANGGVDKNEMILVDEDGNVDPTTPIQYNYSTVTKITVYSTDDAPVSIGNARIKTVVPQPKKIDPDYDNHYCYYGRGIAVRRSNTTLYDIKHSIEGEDMTIEIDRNGDGIIDFWGADRSYGVPYIGFFYFVGCNKATLTDSLLQGHQAYSFWQGATRNEPGNIRNEMGSYDLNATDCINLSLLNLTQYENKETGEVITNRKMYHGVMGSNFCRNVVMDNCYVDRFDSHQGVHNARITNCTLGFGILVIGGGELYVENVHRVGGNAFIHLRMDYNSVFDGDVTVKNCRCGEQMKILIEGRWVKFYNGLDNHVTNNLTVDGLVCDSGEFAFYSIRNLEPTSTTDDVNRLYLPEKIVASNVFAADGVTPLVPEISEQKDAFSATELIIK